MLIELGYFPPVAHFGLFRASNDIWIEEWEHYQKNSYRNRCYIATSREVLRLTVPLQKGKHEQQPVRDVRISYDTPWQRQQRQSIVSAYGKAPFFLDYEQEILPFFDKKYIFLFDMNWEIFEKINGLLGIETPFYRTQKYEPTELMATDWRNKIKPNEAAENYFYWSAYPQIFETVHGFLPNLSILDLLFCTGPEALSYLPELK